MSAVKRAISVAGAMVLYLVLTHAGPTTSHGVVGARKLATALYDCTSVVAFCGTGAHGDAKNPLAFQVDALDKGVGWSKDSGEFTCHCPGLYQFSFAGDAKLTLKKQFKDDEVWKNIISNSGANTILLDMEVGDKVAIWLQEGDLSKGTSVADAPTSSFSGYRIAKK